MSNILSPFSLDRNPSLGMDVTATNLAFDFQELLKKSVKHAQAAEYDLSAVLFTPPLIPTGIRRNPGIPEESAGMDQNPQEWAGIRRNLWLFS